MKSMNMKLQILSLFVAGMLPVSHVHAWRWWSGAAPQLKIVEAAVTKKAEKEAQKSRAAQYAMYGGQVVLSAAGKTAVGTAKFAWNHPKIAAGVVAGGYLYAKRNAIAGWFKGKYQEYKPHLKAAAAVSAITATAIAAKRLHDSLHALTGSNEPQKLKNLSAQELNNLAELVKQKLADAKSEEKKEVVQLLSKSESQEMNKAWDAIAQELEREQQEAPAQSASAVVREPAVHNFDQRRPVMAQSALSRKEINELDAIYNQVAQPESAVAKQSPARKTVSFADDAGKKLVETRTIPNRFQAESELHIAANEKRPATEMDRQFHNELHGPQLHSIWNPSAENVDKDTVAQWVREYHQMADPNQTEWVQEFNEQDSDESGIVSKEQEDNEVELALVPKAEPAPVTSFEDIHAVGRRRDLQRMEDQAYERIRIIANQLQPNCRVSQNS